MQTLAASPAAPPQSPPRSGPDLAAGSAGGAAAEPTGPGVPSLETVGGASLKVLAIASRGGHWVQLLRLRPSLENATVTFATTDAAYAADVPGERFYAVPDASLSSKWRMLMLLLAVARLIGRVRPDVIITTGAAPGYFAVRVGRLLGAKTIWIDSVANAERMSLAGRHARGHADHWLSQWPQVAEKFGAEYAGAVL